MIMIFAEITTSATVNYEAVIRETLKEIGHDDPAKGLDYKTVNVIVAIEEQSPHIAQSADSAKVEDIGAGDQGIGVWLRHERDRNLYASFAFSSHTARLAFDRGAQVARFLTGCGPTVKPR